MENIKTDIQRQVEERIRIESIKKQTRACKEKLFEMCSNEAKQK